MLHELKFISLEFFKICFEIKNSLAINFFHKCQIIVDGSNEKVEEKLLCLQSCKSPPIIVNLFKWKSRISFLNLFYLLCLAINEKLQTFLQLMSLFFRYFIINSLSYNSVFFNIKNDGVLKKKFVVIHWIHHDLKMSFPYIFANSNNAREGTLDGVEKICSYKTYVYKTPFQRSKQTSQGMNNLAQLSNMLWN